MSKRQVQPEPPAPARDVFHQMRDYNTKKRKSLEASLHGLLTPPPVGPKPKEVTQNVIVPYGRNNMNLYDLYESLDANLTDANDKVPGIYIICGCPQSPGVQCDECQRGNGRTTTFKVGQSIDLATRLNQYHTSFPHGFQFMRLFALVDPETRRRPPMSTADEVRAVKAVLDAAEYNIINRLNKLAPRVQGINFVRRGVPEYFTTDDWTFVDNTLLIASKWNAEVLAVRDRPPNMTPDNYYIYSALGLRGILLPYVHTYTPSTADAAIRRRKGLARVLAATGEEVEGMETRRQWASRAQSVRRRVVSELEAKGELAGGYLNEQGTHGVMAT